MKKFLFFDKNNLEEITITKEICDISAGLFLPLEQVWKGIRKFLETGTAFDEIERISPDDLPECGNY